MTRRWLGTFAVYLSLVFLASYKGGKIIGEVLAVGKP